MLQGGRNGRKQTGSGHPQPHRMPPDVEKRVDRAARSGSGLKPLVGLLEAFNEIRVALISSNPVCRRRVGSHSRFLSVFAFGHPVSPTSWIGSNSNRSSISEYL